MRRFSEFIADTMRIPKDVAMDLPRISVCGDKEIYVENHKGLAEYQDTHIRIKSRDGIIHISGSGLRIIVIRHDSFVINGEFEMIEYEKLGRNRKNVKKIL